MMTISCVKLGWESGVGLSRDSVAFLDSSLFVEIKNGVEEPDHSQSEGAVDDVEVSRAYTVGGKLDQVHQMVL